MLRKSEGVLQGSSCAAVSLVLVFVLGIALSTRADIPLPNIPPNFLYITNYGAIGDNVTTNTAAIQDTINAANAAGGGIVVVAGGTFLSGPLTLKNSVNLRIETNSMLKMLPYGSYPGGTSPTDFIGASSLHDIAISGFGIIEGQGGPWWAAYDASGINRPKAMFAPSNCRTVLVENVTMQSPPNTHISLRSVCREVTIRGITINTTSDVISANTDGVDVDATNCVIQNCRINCGDDHVAMGGDSGWVTITNCIFGNGHGISIGSHTDGGLRNVFVKDCSMTISSGLSSGIRMKSGRDRGGFARDLLYFDLTFTNNQNPIFISSYYPDSTIPANPTTDAGVAVTETTPIWRDITISNVYAIASSGRNAGRVYGLPEMAITNLTVLKTTVTADKGFDMYHVRNARFMDTQINVPGGINTFNIYDVDLSISNATYNSNLVKIGGWSSSSITNRLAFFNAKVSATDTNVLPRTRSLALGNAVLTVANNWNVDPLTAFNFTLGDSNATVAVTGNLTLNGTINIAAGPGFTNGSYTIFTYGNALMWGTTVLGTLPVGYNGNFDTNVAGKVRLVVSDSTLPSLSPTNISVVVSNDTLQLSWAEDHTGWRLQSQTNGLEAGLFTNWIDVPQSGQTNNAIVPIDHVSAAVFYRLIYP